MAQLKRSEAFTETSQKLRVPLLHFRTNAGAAMAATTPAAAGEFAVVSGTYGVGGTKLQGEAASGNTKTSYAKATVALPINYVAGSDFTIVIKHRVSVVLNTTANLVPQCYLSNGQGGVTGSNQVTTGAVTNNTASWVESTFSVTGTGFSPGDELDVYIRHIADDSGGANSGKGEVGSVYLGLSTKM